VFKNQEILDQESVSNKIYYPTGQLKEQFNLLNDKLHGAYISYSTSVKICARIRFFAGVLHGTSYNYNDNGELLQKAQYKEGRLHGRLCVYDNDMLQLIVQYKNGLKNGFLTIIGPNKHVTCRQQFVNDKLHGLSKFFDEKNNIIQISEYKNGKLHGKLIQYDNQGKEVSSHLYENGELIQNKGDVTDDQMR